MQKYGTGQGCWLGLILFCESKKKKDFISDKKETSIKCFWHRYGFWEEEMQYWRRPSDGPILFLISENKKLILDGKVSKIMCCWYEEMANWTRLLAVLNVEYCSFKTKKLYIGSLPIHHSFVILACVKLNFLKNVYCILFRPIAPTLPKTPWIGHCAFNHSTNFTQSSNHINTRPNLMKEPN